MTHQPTFSPATIKALTDVVTGGPGTGNAAPPIGIYRSASVMEGLMMECGLDFRVGGMSSRVTSLTNFLRGLLDDLEGVRKLTDVVVRVCQSDDYRAEPERQQAVIDHLNRPLSRDGLVVALVGGEPRLQERGKSGAIIGAVAAKAATIDFDTVDREVKRALASADTDPEDAVTAACSIIESVCRSILVELQLPLPAKKDIDGLVRAVQVPLNLSPGRSDLPDEIAADVRQILGGLTTTAKGIGALRTHGGDAHGRERGFRRLDARIARLAVHAASTLALFLIETWERTTSGRTLPAASDPTTPAPR